MRKNQPRHYAFETTKEARAERVAQERQAADDASKRIHELHTSLLRKMPADHAALKVIVRELRDLIYAYNQHEGNRAAAWVEDNYVRDRNDLPLSDLLQLARTFDYRYSYTRKANRPYIDFALTFIRWQLQNANAMLFSLVNGDLMHVRGDEKEGSR